MSDKPPTRYTEEGVSLPERGSGYTKEGTPVFDQRTRGDQPSAPSQLDNGTVPREPEKLALPPEAIGDLIQLAIQQGAGNAWWRGFVAAHGHPSWIVQGRWRLVVRDGADIVKAEPQER